MNKVELVTNARMFYRYTSTVKRSRRHSSYHLDSLHINNLNTIELMQLYLEVAELSGVVSRDSIRLIRNLDMEPNFFTSENDLDWRLVKFKAKKRDELKKARHSKNVIEPLKELDTRIGFNILLRNFNNHGSYGLVQTIDELIYEETDDSTKRAIKYKYAKTIAYMLKKYRERMDLNTRIQFDKTRELDRKKQAIKEKHAMKKNAKAPNAAQLIQKIVEVAQSLDTATLKRHVFGNDCDTNLKVVAREGKKATLDNTTNHKLRLSELQELSVLVKWIQTQGDTPIEFDIIDSYHDDIHDYISPEQSNSCHKRYGGYSDSPQYLLDNGVKVLRLMFTDNKFIRFYYIEMDKGIAQSDAYYFSASGKSAVSSGTLTFKLLAQLAGIETDNPFNANVYSENSDSVYINEFETFIGLPQGTVHLEPENENMDKLCVYSEEYINVDSQYYHNCYEVIETLADNFNISLGDYYNDYEDYHIVSENYVNEWLDSIGVIEYINEQITDTVYQTRH